MTDDDTVQDELATLRGIARRIGEGWRANQQQQVWRASPVHAEPMTPAEVAAIWPELAGRVADAEVADGDA